MEESLISFETAKLAKGKGFNVNVLNYYNKYGVLNNGHSLMYNNISNYNMMDDFSAPTQSLLQKWLREKHKKHIDINPFYYKGDFISWNLRIHSTYYKDKYNSYEEALEIGLQEVLKLIKQ